MRKKTMLITGAASAAVVLGGASIALAASQQSRDVLAWSAIPLVVRVADLQDDDPDSPAQPLSSEDRDKAGNAALAKVGQGTVSDIERENDGGSAYEVQIRLNDGSEVEVLLGADFQVLNQGAPERDDD